MELSDIRARQMALEWLMLTAYQEFSLLIKLLTDVDAPKFLNETIGDKYQETLEHHRQTCRAEMIERIREAREKKEFPLHDFIN